MMSEMTLCTTQARIYDGAVLRIYLMSYYLLNKGFIIDVGLGYTYASESIEIFKGKLRWSKSSWLLQRIAFIVYFALS